MLEERPCICWESCVCVCTYVYIYMCWYVFGRNAGSKNYLTFCKYCLLLFIRYKMKHYFNFHFTGFWVKLGIFYSVQSFFISFPVFQWILKKWILKIFLYISWISTLLCMLQILFAVAIIYGRFSFKDLYIF